MKFRNSDILSINISENSILESQFLINDLKEIKDIWELEYIKKSRYIKELKYMKILFLLSLRISIY